MRTIVAFFIAASVLWASPPPAYAAFEGPYPTPFSQMQRLLATAADHAPGRIAMEVRDLTTGYTSGVHANTVMPAASTIKIPIMVEVFKQMEAGRFDFNRRVELTANDRDWGSGDLADAPLGTTFPVSELLAQMITVSDNTAANMLIRLVGRRNINATMRDLGLHHTELSNYIRTTEWDVRSTLRTTPSDMVKLLTDMAKHDLIDRWSSQQMIAILERDEINTLLPEPLPEIPIAHKTGSFQDTLNDVGIVYAAGAPYVIAVMTTDLPSLPAGRTFIRDVSRVAYTHLEKLAKWRAANAAATAEALEPAAAAPRGVIPDVPMWGPSSGNR